MPASRSAAVTRPWPTRKRVHWSRSVVCSAGDSSPVAGIPHYVAAGLCRDARPGFAWTPGRAPAQVTGPSRPSRPDPASRLASGFLLLAVEDCHDLPERAVVTDVAGEDDVRDADRLGSRIDRPEYR